MDVSEALLPLLGLGLLAPAMALAWLRQCRTSNAGVVDVLWAAGLGVLAVGYALLAGGWGPRRALVGLMAGVWSARLTVHLARRVAGEPEDGRYARLRRELGPRFRGWSFGFFQVQAVLAVVLSVAFLVPATWEAPRWHATDAAAVLLWLVSLAGEAVADRQLAAWREDPAKRGRVCRVGLWRLSRHPNYFFEWLHWLVYPLLAAGSPYALAALAPAGLMLFLILKVTGIPPTEEQALASRGDAYREYQRTTNAFFPGPPKDAGSPATTTR